jgi:cytosine deaminase
MTPLWLCGGQLTSGRYVDLGLTGGHIWKILDNSESSGTENHPRSREGSAATEEIDLAGFLLLPAPVEPHAHLDKVYTADLVGATGADLPAAVEAWLAYRPTVAEAEIAVRATAAVRSYVGHGVTALRTHVDVGEDVGLRGLAALRAVRDALSAVCDIQIVAFPSVPLTGTAGAKNRALLREAVVSGADVVGGCPARDPDPAACVAAALTIAAEAGLPVDLHIDEHLEAAPDTLSLLADAVTGMAFPHRVAASHCVSLGMAGPERARAVAERLVAAGIAVISLPHTNLYLQGRDHRTVVPRGLTAVRILREAGVTVAAGGDNLQDPFNCLGRADPLETAALLVLAGHDSPEAAYASISSAARTALGLSSVDITEGSPAELMAIRAANVRMAIATGDPDRVVFHAGRLVARTETTRYLPAPPISVPTLEVNA